MLRGRPVVLGVFGARLDVHYTTDGSEPTEESPQADGAVTVSDPGKARLKEISTRGEFDREIAVKLKLGAPLAPVGGIRSAQQSEEWRYSLFQEEAWPNLGTKRAAKPVGAGSTTKDLSLKDIGRERVAGRLIRTLVVPSDGYFIFALRASRGRLRLGNTVLISNEGPDDQRMRSFLAPLRAGSYPLSVDFVTATEHPSLYLAVFRYADDQPKWWNQHPWMEVGAR